MVTKEVIGKINELIDGSFFVMDNRKKGSDIKDIDFIKSRISHYSLINEIEKDINELYAASKFDDLSNIRNILYLNLNKWILSYNTAADIMKGEHKKMLDIKSHAIKTVLDIINSLLDPERYPVTLSYKSIKRLKEQHEDNKKEIINSIPNLFQFIEYLHSNINHFNDWAEWIPIFTGEQTDIDESDEEFYKSNVENNSSKLTTGKIRTLTRIWLIIPFREKVRNLDIADIDKKEYNFIHNKYNQATTALIYKVKEDTDYIREIHKTYGLYFGFKRKTDPRFIKLYPLLFASLNNVMMSIRSIRYIHADKFIPEVEFVEFGKKNDKKITPQSTTAVSSLQSEPHSPHPKTSSSIENNDKPINTTTMDINFEAIFEVALTYADDPEEMKEFCIREQKKAEKGHEYIDKSFYKGLLKVVADKKERAKYQPQPGPTPTHIGGFFIAGGGGKRYKYESIELLERIIEELRDEGETLTDLDLQSATNVNTADVSKTPSKADTYMSPQMRALMHRLSSLDEVDYFKPPKEDALTSFSPNEGEALTDLYLQSATNLSAADLSKTPSKNDTYMSHQTRALMHRLSSLDEVDYFKPPREDALTSFSSNESPQKEVKGFCAKEQMDSEQNTTPHTLKVIEPVLQEEKSIKEEKPKQPLYTPKPQKHLSKHYALSFMFDCLATGADFTLYDSKKSDLEAIGESRVNGAISGNTFYKAFNRIMSKKINLECKRDLFYIAGNNWRDIIIELSHKPEEVVKFLEEKEL